MVQHHFVIVVWLGLHFSLVAKRSPKTYGIDAFTIQHISRFHQYYVSTGYNSCPSGRQHSRQCRYISIGINEPLFGINSIDEDIPRSIDTITGDHSESRIIPSKIETLQNSTSTRGITLKMALDRNGGVACRSEIRPERFTCAESLDMVHRLRSESDAVLIGVGTAIVDNPSLLVRRNITVTKQPLRVILDPMLRFINPLPSNHLKHSYQMLSDGYPLVIYHCRNDTTTNPIFVNVTNVLPSSVQLQYVPPIDSSLTDAPRMNVKIIFEHLQKKYHVQHLMVEGGPRTAQLFLQSNLVDRCILVQAPIQFNDPVLSNITPSLLQSANLVQLGCIQSSNDIIECWSRPNLPWPTIDLRHWP